MFPSPHGVISISTYSWIIPQPSVIGFRPLTGLSLYLRFCEGEGIAFSSFRPLTGLSLYLLSMSIEKWREENTFPSPHGVISISTRFWWKGRWKRDLQFPSPHGVISISTVKGRHDGSPGSKFPSPHGVISISTTSGHLHNRPVLCFRPLTGLSLYLPFRRIHKRNCYVQFPSPHGVISISTYCEETIEFPYDVVSVPSRGYLYIYCNWKIFNISRLNVSVPSRGYLYIYNVLVINDDNTVESFRPLTGLSLYLPDGEKW